jgi:hypothetical protein
MEPSRGVAGASERAGFLASRNNAINHPFTHMIAITITPEAYEGVLLGTAEAPSPKGQDGLIRVWLDCKFVDRLGACAAQARAIVT